MSDDKLFYIVILLYMTVNLLALVFETGTEKQPPYASLVSNLWAFLIQY